MAKKSKIIETKVIANKKIMPQKCDRLVTKLFTNPRQAYTPIIFNEPEERYYTIPNGLKTNIIEMPIPKSFKERRVLLELIEHYPKLTYSKRRHKTKYTKKQMMDILHKITFA